METAEKREWYGQAPPLPDDDELKCLKIGFCFLKPDAYERGLFRNIVRMIKGRLKIKAARRFIFRPEKVFFMYPGLHYPDWARNLLTYLTGGSCLAIVVSGPDCLRVLQEIKEAVRERYVNDQIVNLLHVSDSETDAVREALIIFKKEELLKCN
ncbi:MAG: nucleoside-diphosphate kinase [Candidatus Falkowbacteria bacterium]